MLKRSGFWALALGLLAVLLIVCVPVTGSADTFGGIVRNGTGFDHVTTEIFETIDGKLCGTYQIEDSTTNSPTTGVLTLIAEHGEHRVFRWHEPDNGRWGTVSFTTSNKGRRLTGRWGERDGPRLHAWNGTQS